MWFCKDQSAEVTKLRNRAKELEVALIRKTNELSEANARLRAVEDEVSKAPVAIDFDTMRVFSIERSISNNRPCTIIGYYVNDPVLSADGEMVVDRDQVKEWTLSCNNQRHEELVKKFNELKKK